MALDRFGRAPASWARCSLVMAMAVGCGSGSSLLSQATDERRMAHEASLGEEDDPNPFVFSFDSHAYGISMKEWAFNWTLCPNPALHPAPGQSPFDFFSEGLTEINGGITVLDVTGEDT